jgi:hypothetical protein
VSRIDAATNTVTARTARNDHQPDYLLALTTDRDSVWVVEAHGRGSTSLRRLHPTTLDVLGSLELRTAITGVTTGLGSVWITGRDHLIQLAPR